MKLTLRQVSLLLKTIDKGKYEELQIQAKLHGLKMKDRAHSLDLTTEERQASTELAESTFQRMKREHKARKNDGERRTTD